MAKKIEVYDGETVQERDLVAFYDRMEALNYTAWRPSACAKGVIGIDIVEKVESHQIKGYNTGWWHRLSVIKITPFIALKWLARYRGKAWPPFTGYNR